MAGPAGGLAFAWDTSGRRDAGAVVRAMLGAPSSGSVSLSRSPARFIGLGHGGGDAGDRLATEGDLHVAFDGWLAEDELQVGLPRGAGPARAVLEAFRRWGPSFCQQLRGEFATVVWDSGARQVWAARDPFGVRSLHHAAADGWLLISTDANQILATGLTPAEPDDEMIVQFLTRKFTTETRSFFRSIRRVPSGHLLVGQGGVVSTRDYRTFPGQLSFATVQDSYAAFADIFLRAVRRRLAGNGPVVSQLSGGVDSTSIACAADRLMGDGMFSVSVIAAAALHPGLSCDESVQIDAVRRHIGFPVISWDGTRADGREFEQPVLAGPGTRVAMTGGTEGDVEIAREVGAKVILSGVGGDQVGQPLGTAADDMAEGRWLGAARNIFRPEVPLRRAAHDFMRNAVALARPGVQNFQRSLRSPLRAPSWLSPEFAGRPIARESDAGLRTYATFSQRAHWGYLSEPGLSHSVEFKQRHARLAGMELRFPFLDWDVAAFALSLPSRYWPRLGRFTRLQKEALRGWLPPAIYRRSGKAEFTSALVARVRTQRRWVRDLLLSGPWAAERYVTRRAAQKMYLEFLRTASPDLGTTYRIWAIASLESWLRGTLVYLKRQRLRQELVDGSGPKIE